MNSHCLDSLIHYEAENGYILSILQLLAGILLKETFPLLNYLVTQRYILYRKEDESFIKLINELKKSRRHCPGKAFVSSAIVSGPQHT